MKIFCQPSEARAPFRSLSRLERLYFILTVLIATYGIAYGLIYQFDMSIYWAMPIGVLVGGSTLFFFTDGKTDKNLILSGTLIITLMFVASANSHLSRQKKYKQAADQAARVHMKRRLTQVDEQAENESKVQPAVGGLAD